MKKIVKIIAVSFCLATTTFAMDADLLSEDLQFETKREVYQAINSLKRLQSNLFSELANRHTDDPETAAICTALCSQFTRLNAEFFPSIMENLQTLGKRFDSPLRDIESGSNQDDPLPLYASDEDEGLLAQRGRTHPATNHDLLELDDSDDEAEPKQKEIIDSSLAASAAKSDDKSELPTDIL